MLIIEQIRAPHMLSVEAFVRGLVAPNEKNGRSARIERVEDAYRRPRLDSEFAHMPVLGESNPGRVGKGEAGSVLNEIADDVTYRVLVPNGKAVPPCLELVGVFDGEGHGGVEPKPKRRNESRRRPKPPGCGRDLRFTRGADALQENGCGLVVRILGDKAALERAFQDGLAEGGGLGIESLSHPSPGKPPRFPQ